MASRGIELGGNLCNPGATPARPRKRAFNRVIPQVCITPALQAFKASVQFEYSSEFDSAAIRSILERRWQALCDVQAKSST